MGFVKNTGHTPAANLEAEDTLAHSLAALNDSDADTRRHAVHHLAHYPEAIPPLCQRLENEPDIAVRTSILTALIKIGVPQAAGCLIPYLRSENVALRNDVIVALQEMQHISLPLVEQLLTDSDTDIRIFAINILARIRDPQVPALLLRVIEIDPHINVWSTALDAIAETGTQDMVPTIQASLDRFDNEYGRFAVQFAIQRISE
ncbi:MAG TPA: HEAT repeat domain-containing protein [Methylophilaceae bacterium]|nr:HEAT repeat domain-containing protein [Methylophilaceae bacterium]